MATAQEESSINLVLNNYFLSIAKKKEKKKKKKERGRKWREDSEDNDYRGFQFVSRKGWAFHAIWVSDA
jgi:HSP20 family molecular chaperone IbpA